MALIPDNQTSVNSGSLTPDDIYDQLSIIDDASNNEEKEEIDLKPKKEVKEKEEDNEKELEEEKEVEEEEEEEEEDEIKIEDEKEKEKEEEFQFHKVPRRKEILAKYPNIQKEFPGLFAAVYDQQKYAEVFPTIHDAREAKEQLDSYSQLSSSLNQGTLNGVLSELKGKNPEAFNKITNNFLGELKSANEESYWNLLSNVISSTLKKAFDSGKSQNNEDLALASKILNQFVFGEQSDPEIKGIAKQTTDENPEVKKLREQQIEFNRQRLTAATGEVGGKIDNLIRNTVNRYIDPKETMSSYVRNKAIDDVMSRVNKELSTDTSFRGVVDRLWKKAIEANYGMKEKEAIRNAFVSKAQVILPQILREVRSEALKGNVAREKKTVTKSESDQSERVSSKGTNSKKSDIPKNMSTLDFLSSD